MNVGAVGHDRHQNAALQAAAATVSGQLTELTGTEPRVINEPHAIRIETCVTDPALRLWPRLLAILELGSEYGVRHTSDGQVAWLRIQLRGKSPRP